MPYSVRHFEKIYFSWSAAFVEELVVLNCDAFVFAKHSIPEEKQIVVRFLRNIIHGGNASPDLTDSYG